MQYRTVLLSIFVTAFLGMFLLGTTPLSGQVQRLPASDTSELMFPGRTVSYPGSTAELFQAPGELDLPKQPERPPGARAGMFQKLIFTGSWLGRGGVENFGASDLELKTILALPIPSRDYPLIITPGFGVHYLDGPAGRNVPARVYDAYVQFRWMRRIGSNWGIDLAVTQGVFSDFEHNDSRAYRITGHAVSAYTCNPQWKIVLGAAYIDRFSTNVLPVAGVQWTPRDEWKLDLVFPHPRIAWRYNCNGPEHDRIEDWLYIAGELGGGTWAVAEPSQSSEMIDYTDYRLILGLQRKVTQGLDAHAEIGYVFERKIRFERSAPEYRPAGTVMLRAGVTY